LDPETLFKMREEDGLDWERIYPLFPDYKPSSLRGALTRYKQRKAREAGPPTPEIFGVTAGEEMLDEAEVWERVVAMSRKRKAVETRKVRQVIRFSHGPICIVNLADIHAGGTGVDYDRLDQDLALIDETPGMFPAVDGDILDNFIIGKLAQLQVNRDFSIAAEWVLVKKILTMMGPKLLWAVGGNHDKWTYSLAGIDYFREVVKSIRPGVLYDQDEILVDVYVGEALFKWRIRHKWRGSSQYSPTHAIEKAAKFDKGKEFDIGIGAHTHEAGVARFFNNGGKTGLAVLCGAYKRHDDHALAMGFPKANDMTAVPVILTEDGQILTSNSLEAAADYMAAMYDDKGEK